MDFCRKNLIFILNWTLLYLEFPQNQKVMIDKLKETLNQASEILKEQTSNIGEVIKEGTSTISDAAKEKSQKLIEDWLMVFRRLEEYGFKITSFGLGVAISPSLEVEMEGSAEQFTLERINELLEENKESSSLSSVFKTIKTTYELHGKISSQKYDLVLVKVLVKITPEIKVVLGEPKLHL